MIIKSFKYRIYPTRSQEILLNKTFGCVRVVWNHNVEKFNKNEVSLTSTELRKEFEWMKEVSAAALQQKEMDFKQFKNQFFSKTRKKKVRKPNFKNKHARQSFRLPNQKFKIDDNFIKLEKLGNIKYVKLVPAVVGKMKI